MEMAVADNGVVRREEWRRRGSGGLQHTHIEATHWSAPAHSYGKVVEGVSCVGADGRSLKARRQVEVLSARGPGLLQVLTATHTTSRSHSSTTTGFNSHFDDLQLSIHPLDVSPQKDKLSIGRSGMLSGRRPPTKVRSLVDGSSTVSRLCHWFDADSQPQELQSPSIVANGSHKINNLPTVGAESKNGSDKHSTSSESADPNDSPSKNSEDNFYDSCPERESLFKDESEHMEEWRRASKVRRSLQYPGKTSRNNSSKPLDLPDNWGSVSRIKRELENCHKNSLFTKNAKSFSITSDESSKAFFEKPYRPEDISEEPENVDVIPEDDFLIKPSALKKKSFINLETLNELREKLKTVSNQSTELDDGIEAEDAEKTDTSFESKTTAPNVRSYVNGMEATINKTNYPSGTNSLESRVSKLINGAASRSEDWHSRRKSYGFEKVQSSQKITNHLLSNHDKNNMESSTDSGICRSTEVVNALNQSRGTIITLGNGDKKESFESWLQNNRKPSKFPIKQDDLKSDNVIAQSTNQISINIPVKDVSPPKNDVFQRLYENHSRKHDNLRSSITYPSKSEEMALKRHTIAVDGFKNPLSEYSNDLFEKKSKKVEFCKTEVHFTADSGKVNIVETDEKPPSTNNFRRRRRNSGVTPMKEVEKNNLPVMHFGDSFVDTKTEQNGNDDSKDLKLNYAIITEIKGTTKENDHDTKDVPTNGSDETSESEPPRGILKNKPIKPKPYHLGEDKNVLMEINNTQYAQEKNVWGIKLKPIHDRTETPLWCSTVTLKNEFNEPLLNQDSKELNDSSKSGYGKIEKKHAEKTMHNDTNSGLLSVKSIAEHKGYSTKINFGNGDPVVETSYNLSKILKSPPTHKDMELDYKPKTESNISNGTKQSSIVSKYLSNSSNKFSLESDELKVVDKIKSAMNISNNAKPEPIKEATEKKDGTFADSINTPRSLMPTRGSARKLKEHELSYFGIKSTEKSANENQNSLKRLSNSFKSVQQETIAKESEVKHISSKVVSNASYQSKAIDDEINPIYENLKMSNKNEVNMKRIHSGESIIDELTKAADEILQALNDYSDDDSTKYSDSNSKNKNGQPLETITESVTWKDKLKTSEHKAVQTIIGGTRKYNTVSNAKTVKTRTSSNSSLESITKEMKTASIKKKQVVEDLSIEKPERPLRKKGSSVDVIKARRLQRASSREALMQFHGSSSEDIAGHLDVSRKKTVRRSKHNGDSLKRDESKPIKDVRSKKESSRSASKYISGMLPEIRHKTAVSTIMSLTNGDKSKSGGRHRERVKESTISSLTKCKERSHSTDTSLERDNGHSKERHFGYKKDKSKTSDSEKLRRTTDHIGSDAEKKNKISLTKKSTVSTTTNGSLRGTQRSSQPTRSYDRSNAAPKATNVRTEYDKNYRLI